MTSLAMRVPEHIGLVDTVIDLFTGMRRRSAARSARTRVFNELATMTDRELADIGLNRGMISDIAALAA